jgi:hypothetical protein
MEVVVDRDVLAILEFMQRNVPASKLVAVSRIVHIIAPVLWSHYAAEQVCPLSLRERAIWADDRRTQSNANESILG